MAKPFQHLSDCCVHAGGNCCCGYEAQHRKKGKKNEINRVDIDWKTGDVSFYFEDKPEAGFSSLEFVKGSATRSKLEAIEAALFTLWKTASSTSKWR